MALNAGNPECTTGLSKDFLDAWTPLFPRPYNDLGESDKAQVRAMCFAFATAAVNHLKTNAVVTVVDGNRTLTGTLS